MISYQFIFAVTDPLTGLVQSGSREPPVVGEFMTTVSYTHNGGHTESVNKEAALMYHFWYCQGSSIKRSSFWLLSLTCGPIDYTAGIVCSSKLNDILHSYK